MSQKRRRALNIEEKSHIIFRLENGESNGEIAKECGISHSTISMIWKNKDKIKALFEENCLNIKRSRASEHTVIDEALLKWCKHQRENNVPISGPILQQKANDLALLMGIENFDCSSSWIHRFRVRHNFVAGKKCGEAESVMEEWLSHEWPALCEGYKPEEIFNADETALYFYLTPEKTFKFKEEQCKSGKLSKTRMTVLVTANMTGSRKQKLLVIGNSKIPHCFKNSHSLPVIYEHNTRPMMTSQIFEEWLRIWDTQLESEGNKILLLVDSCSAHPVVPNLKCIKLVFLPTNVTCVSQPMVQGVIKDFKTEFRKLQALQLVQNIEIGENIKSFSILDVITMISEAWGKVTQSTIANCFRQTGFKDLSTSPEEDDDIPLASRIHSSTDEDEIYLGQLDASLVRETKIEIDEFKGIDDNVAMCSPVIKEEILVEVESNNHSTDEESEDQQEQVPPTICEVINAIKTLQKFVAFNEEFNSDANQILKKMKCKLQNQIKKKQTKMTDYFKN